ncbi:MAG: hypothetical protein ABL933_18150 [Methyloglobulus sp.]
MSQIITGIDIAKLKYDVARLCEGKYKHAKFANGSDGFTVFVAWLNRYLAIPASAFAWTTAWADILLLQYLHSPHPCGLCRRYTLKGIKGNAGAIAEATGAYSLPLAESLADNGYFVGVINPAFMPFGCKSMLPIKAN